MDRRLLGRRLAAFTLARKIFRIKTSEVALAVVSPVALVLEALAEVLEALVEVAAELARRAAA